MLFVHFHLMRSYMIFNPNPIESSKLIFRKFKKFITLSKTNFIWNFGCITYAIKILHLKDYTVLLNSRIHPKPNRALIPPWQNRKLRIRMSLPASVCVKNVFEGNFLTLKITVYEWLAGIESSFYTRMLMTHTLLIIPAIWYASYSPYLPYWPSDF